MVDAHRHNREQLLRRAKLGLLFGVAAFTTSSLFLVVITTWTALIVFLISLVTV